MSGPLSGIVGFGVGLWQDKGRALTALVSAFVLWFLLGGQVQRTEKVFLVVRVLAQSDTTTVADGLTVRIPDAYAVEEFEPKSFDLELKGTSEDLSRVDGGLSGVYMAPDDLLGKETRREVTLDVARDFQFARLKALPNLSIEGRPFVQLRVTKRERVDVALTRDNLLFEPESLGAGIKVEFTPSILPVSGPDADIARIREDPRRLKVGPTIDERLLQSFTADAQTLPSNSVAVLGSDNRLHRPPLLRVNNGDPEMGLTGAHEVGVTMAIPLGAFNFSTGYFYDLTIGGQYFQAAVDYTYAVNDWLSIVPAVQAGYGINYYTGTRSNSAAFVGLGTQSSGFTHVLFSVATPIQLTKIATLTPYVAWNFSGSTRNYLNATHDNEIFGGVKLSVSF